MKNEECLADLRTKYILLQQESLRLRENNQTLKRLLKQVRETLLQIDNKYNLQQLPSRLPQDMQQSLAPHLKRIQDFLDELNNSSLLDE